MNPDTAFYYAWVTPWLAVSLLAWRGLVWIRGSVPRPWVAGWILLATAVLCWLPVGGLPLHRWVITLQANFALPFTLMLGIGLIESVRGQPLLREAERFAWAWFGSGSGLILYPLALGWTGVDAYAWGWGTWPLLAGVILLTLVCLIRGNRFGFGLLLALAAWFMPIQESLNLWDYLVDPLYLLTAIGWLIQRFVRRSTLRAAIKSSP